MPPVIVEDVLKKVEVLALPIAAQLGLELVELGGHVSGRDVHIEILADRPAGGITIEECATLNRFLVDAIDKDGFLGEDYTLGVSSPGLDRPLRTKKDYLRSINYEIRFLLTTKVEGKGEYQGQLVSVDGETLTVGLKKGKTVVLPIATIQQGLLVI